jgi:transcriptional regulator with XRE-family HTH domain
VVKLTKLEKLLTDRGINNAFVARKCGVSNPTIYRWRNGETKMPAEAALIISGLLDVDVEDVIGDIVQPAKKKVVKAA